MTAQSVLTIDLGTSGVKCAVVAESGAVLGAGRAPVATQFGPEGAAEQDPEAVWDATVGAARAAIAEWGGRPGDVAAVIASSQYSSVVAVDASGRPTAPMILWMDQRGSPRRLRAAGARRANPLHLADWFRRHGIAPIEGGITLNHIRWVLRCRPDVYARTANFLEPMDYLTLRLTGRATANPCTAFMFLLTDNRPQGRAGWDSALVAHTGLDAAKLPELVAPGADVGSVLPDVAAAIGVASTTRVLSGLNDTQAGALAAGAATGDGAALSIGTTAVIAARCERHRADPRTSVFASPGPLGAYLMSAENGVAGAALDHATRLLYGNGGDADDGGPPDYAALTADAAAAPPGAGGVLYLPWVRGALAPSADGRVRGGWLNVGLEHERRHLARAVPEGIALNVGRLRRPAERFAGRRFTSFTVYGGGAQSDLWCQVFADVLGAPVRQLDQPGYANCVGAGLFAFARLGRIDAAEIGDRVPVRTVYEPDAATGPVYAELAERFDQAFDVNRPLFHALYSARRLWAPRPTEEAHDG
jgi:xylulokinase